MSFAGVTIVALLALGPTAAAAQVSHAATHRPTFALGVGGGACGTVPDAGGLVSVSFAERLSLDLTLAWQPRVWRSPETVLAAAAARVPFHAGSRYSMVAGVARVTARHQRSGDSGLFPTSGRSTLPVVGASLQWPRGRSVDLRVDAQAFVVAGSDVPLIPRAIALLVWHPGPARSDPPGGERP